MGPRSAGEATGDKAGDKSTILTAYSSVNINRWQKAQLSQRGRAMLRATVYFAKSLKVIEVIRNDTVR